MQHYNPVAFVAATVLALGSIAPASAGSVTSDGSDIEIKTKGGFEVKTKDGNYAIAIGGRIQLDYNRYDGVINEIEGETGSDIFFRRARIQIDGKAKDWSYKASYNLTDSGSIDVLVASYEGWGELTELTFGQQKESFGLEDTGSSKWITAIERSLPANAFSVDKNIGIRLHGANDLITYSVGAFKESVDADDNSLDYALTGRLVVRPYITTDVLVHLGVGFSMRDGQFDSLGARLGVRGGEAGTANQIEAQYDDGAIADESRLWNLEAAAVLGPYHVMAEYFSAELDGTEGGLDIEATGYYLQAAWILTGERRAYKTSKGTLDKVTPSIGIGAWEVFARYDNLDVTNSEESRLIEIDGGEGSSVTLGVNWYARSNVKAAFNYVHAQTDDDIGNEDRGDAVALRLQYLF